MEYFSVILYMKERVVKIRIGVRRWQEESERTGVVVTQVRGDRRRDDVTAN